MKGLPHCSRSCDDHARWGAPAATPSAEGTRVDVLGPCGRPREVTPAPWQAEERRRAEASPPVTPGEEHDA